VARKTFAAAALVGVALVALPAAGQGLRYAEDLAPAIVNPLFTTTMSEARVNELLFSGLYTDDQDLATSPALVAYASLADDQLSMELSLKPDLRWHDGQPVTADDVVFTIEAMRDDDTLSTEAGRVSWIDEATAVDSGTVRLTFTTPQATPEDKLYFKILPRHAFDSTTVSRSDAFRTNPVGSGPYRLARFNDDNSISFTPHSTFDGGVGISELVMREVSDKNYQAKLLLYESLEALVRVLPRDLAVLQNNRKVELYPYQTNSWWYVGFNLERAPFDDVRVRSALSMLIDVDALLAPVGTGEVLSGPFVKSSPFYNHDVPYDGYDPGEASRLLQEAGFDNSSGAWMRDGEALTFTLNAHQTLESSQEVVINLQSQLQNHGVEVSVDFLDEAAWKSRVWRERDFDAILSQWSFDRNEDVHEQLHSDGLRNFGGYESERVDELLDTARDASDPFAKKAALRELHAVVAQDQPMIFLWTLDSYAALSTRVSDVVIHPFYFFTFVNQWRMN